ncbi:MAG: four helix bundle protein [Marinilabiliales bacterium]|nr:MAG: four helix bundle protein [Marinilabiliales bacterium]
MNKANPALDKSFDFAKSIVFLYKLIVKDHKEYVLSKQLLKSGTSIGANITEANGAISEADFSSKISIDYKECLETKYWLKLLNDTNYLSEKDYNVLFEKADELAKILFSILKKTRINK